MRTSGFGSSSERAYYIGVFRETHQGTIGLRMPTNLNTFARYLLSLTYNRYVHDKVLHPVVIRAFEKCGAAGEYSLRQRIRIDTCEQLRENETTG